MCASPPKEQGFQKKSRQELRKGEGHPKLGFSALTYTSAYTYLTPYLKYVIKAPIHSVNYSVMIFIHIRSSDKKYVSIDVRHSGGHRERIRTHIIHAVHPLTGTSSSH